MKYIVLQYKTGEYLDQDISSGGFPTKSLFHNAWILPKNSINLKEMLRYKDMFPHDDLIVVEFEVKEVARYL